MDKTWKHFKIILISIVHAKLTINKLQKNGIFPQVIYFSMEIFAKTKLGKPNSWSSRVRFRLEESVNWKIEYLGEEMNARKL